MHATGYSKSRFFMWVVYPSALIGAIVFMFITCSNNVNNKQDTGALANDTIKKREFVMVDIPQDITMPEERANYLVEHYWDNFDFSDTSYIHLPEITEQAFANYIEILSHANKPTSYFSIGTMLSNAENSSPRVYGYFLEMYNKYLYDPNSPLRNEEFFIPVLNQVVKSERTGDAECERARYTLNLLLKNRVGELATDISYILQSGKTGRLYDIKGEYTLLYFYDPDCTSCESVTHYMKLSPVISMAISNGLLKILAFYPDKNLDLWKNHLNEIPGTWINGYDKSDVVINKQLYDLKAMPTLYLLDKDKKVILKDASIEVIEDYLKRNNPITILEDTGSPR